MGIVVAVGSRNPVKVRGVERAFRRYYDVVVEPVDVSTPIPQPIGRDVVYWALVRAVKALEASERASMGVGIEAGPIEFYTGGGFIETQVAVIVDSGCRASMGLSPSFELPRRVLKAVLEGVELSKAVEVRRGGDIGEGIGYVGILSRGKITRLELTEQAIVMALLPRVAGYELYSVDDISSRLGLKVECRPERER